MLAVKALACMSIAQASPRPRRSFKNPSSLADGAWMNNKDRRHRMGKISVDQNNPPQEGAISLQACYPLLFFMYASDEVALRVKYLWGVP